MVHTHQRPTKSDWETGAKGGEVKLRFKIQNVIKAQNVSEIASKGRPGQPTVAGHSLCQQTRLDRR